MHKPQRRDIFVIEVKLDDREALLRRRAWPTRAGT